MLITTEGPSAEGNEVKREWAAEFTVAGAPNLQISGSERAVFRGDRIEFLEVVLAPEILSRLIKYSETYVAPRTQ